MTTAASLQVHTFSGYPPEARRIAADALETLRPLPPLFVATLLRQISRYDWLFPPERTLIVDQLRLLKDQSPVSLYEAARKFAQIRLPEQLERMDWAVRPDRFSEALTAYLWESHQLDFFREISASYTATLEALRQKPLTRDPRLCLVLMGQEARAEGEVLFSKLRPRGTLFENVSTVGAVEAAVETLRNRAQKTPGPYLHWWIDGATKGLDPPSVTVSYDALEPVRRQVLAIMEDARTTGSSGPEGLRSILHDIARTHNTGPNGASDPILDRFTLDLFADGSGTQIYSTTFVQWAAREVLRRAQPSTLILRYAPRQSERPLNELIAGNNQSPTLDPQGSLVDADMGSFYTWLNLRRLGDGAQSTFVVCHEGGRQAIAVSPAMAAGVASVQPCDLRQILNWAV